MSDQSHPSRRGRFLQSALSQPSLLLAILLLWNGGVSTAQNAEVELIDLNQARMENVRQMDLTVALTSLAKVLNQSDDPAVQASILKGILVGLEGQRNVPAPEGWNELSQQLGSGGDQKVTGLTLQLSQVFGDEEATQRALAILKDSKAETSARKRALTSLLTQRRQELVPILKSLLDEDALRVDAIRGFTTIPSPDAPKLLLTRYPNLNPSEQQAIVETLATRKPYAEALFTALESGTVKREAVPAYVARQMSALLGEKFTEAYGVEELSEDKEKQIGKYVAMATPEAMEKADASAGRAVYQKACMACHVMYGEGGIIGPELTGSNRADLNYLLLNILYPSDDIADAYKMVMVMTKDGQALAGSIVEEDAQKVVLNMVGQQTTVPKSDIKSRETAPVSMMPAGLLQTLQPQEVLDLFKYMKTTEQVPLPH